MSLLLVLLSIFMCGSFLGLAALGLKVDTAEPKMECLACLMRDGSATFLRGAESLSTSFLTDSEKP